MPMPGDFPVLRIVDCNATTVKPLLTDTSFNELSAMSDEKFARWWGYNPTHRDHFPSRIDSPIIDVSIGSGLSHIRDIILSAELEQSYEHSTSILCPMSRKHYISSIHLYSSLPLLHAYCQSSFAGFSTRNNV